LAEGNPETGYVDADRSCHPNFTLADGAGHTFFSADAVPAPAQQPPPLRPAPHGEAPPPRRWLPHAPYRRPADACPLPGTLSTSCNKGPRRCLPVGTARQCWTLLLGRILLAADYCLRVARRMLFTSRSDEELTDVDFSLISIPSEVTMSPKSSLPQATNSVSMAPTPNTMSPNPSLTKSTHSFQKA
jgi:hypothetical protein